MRNLLVLVLDFPAGGAAYPLPPPPYLVFFVSDFQISNRLERWKHFELLDEPEQSKLPKHSLCDSGTSSRTGEEGLRGVEEWVKLKNPSYLQNRALTSPHPPNPPPLSGAQKVGAPWVKEEVHQLEEAHQIAMHCHTPHLRRPCQCGGLAKVGV